MPKLSKVAPVAILFSLPFLYLILNSKHSKTPTPSSPPAVAATPNISPAALSLSPTALALVSARARPRVIVPQATVIASNQPGSSEVVAATAPDTDTASNTATAPVLNGMSLTPQSVHAGDTFVIHVTLSSPAPAGGITVHLHFGAGDFPVTITEGDDGYQQPIIAGASESSSVITATYNGDTLTDTEQIVPELASFVVSPDTVAPGDDYTLAITLTSPAPPGGTSVALNENGNALDPIVVPEGGTSATAAFAAGSVLGPDEYSTDDGKRIVHYDVTCDDTTGAQDVTIFLPNCSWSGYDPDSACMNYADGEVTTFGHYQAVQNQSRN